MLISLLIAILIAAILYWIAALLLPHPIPALVAAIVLILWLTQRT